MRVVQDDRTEAGHGFRWDNDGRLFWFCIWVDNLLNATLLWIGGHREDEWNSRSGIRSDIIIRGGEIGLGGDRGHLRSGRTGNAQSTAFFGHCGWVNALRLDRGCHSELGARLFRRIEDGLGFLEGDIGEFRMLFIESPIRCTGCW